MKRILFLSACLLAPLSSMTTPYIYRLATLNDIPELLELQSQALASPEDNNNLVILPELFRKDALKKAIDLNRMFVALYCDESGKEEVIGYKKAYLPYDDEADDILYNEVRCLGNETECLFNGQITSMNEHVTTTIPVVDRLKKAVIEYNGGDFTTMSHRKKGVNALLTAYSLNYLAPKIKERQEKEDLTHVAMVYGVTEANANRTNGICSVFRKFLEQNNFSGNQELINHAQFRAFKPSFDPRATELKPLPSTIPGRGCLLIN